MKKYFFILALLIICGNVNAQLEASSTLVADTKNSIVVPEEISKEINLLEYCIQMKEALRLEHNEKGQLYKDGKITKEEWQSYLDNNFFPKDLELSSCVVKAKEIIKSQNTYNTKSTEILK